MAGRGTANTAFPMNGHLLNQPLSISAIARQSVLGFTKRVMRASRPLEGLLPTATFSFPPFYSPADSDSSPPASETTRLREQLMLREAISAHYELERSACHQAIKVLASEMQLAVKAAGKWRIEARDKQLTLEGTSGEVIKLREQVAMLEEALDDRQSMARADSTAEDEFQSMDSQRNASASTSHSHYYAASARSGSRSMSLRSDRPPGGRDRAHDMEKEATTSGSDLFFPDRPRQQPFSAQIPPIDVSRSPSTAVVSERSIEEAKQRQSEAHQALMEEVETLRLEKAELLQGKLRVCSIEPSGHVRSLMSFYEQMQNDGQAEREQHERLHESFTELERQFGNTTEQLAQSLATVTDLRRREEEHQREISELEAHGSAVEREARSLREQLDRQSRQLEQVLATHADALRVAADREARSGVLIARSKQEHIDNEAACAALTTRLSAIQAALGAARNRIAVMEHGNANLELQVVSLRKQVDSNQQDKGDLNIALDAKQQELDLVRRMSVEMEIC